MYPLTLLARFHYFSQIFHYVLNKNPILAYTWNIVFKLVLIVDRSFVKLVCHQGHIKY